MGRKHLVWAAALVLVAGSASAFADGLVVDKARAAFRSSRRGVPKDAIRVRGLVTSTTTLHAFDPSRHGLRVKLGDFVAVAHQPGDGEDAGAFRLRKDVWKLNTKVNGVRTKLRLDTRSGRFAVDVKGANARALRDAGPQYVECTLEVGTSILDDALVFDERGRGSKWIALAQGVVTTPPGLPPVQERRPQGTLVYEILASGEQSTILQPGVQVARNDEQWQALYDQATFPSFNRRPDVDFKQDMVIGVFMGLVSQVHEQRIEITGITDTAEQLHVSWRSRYGCFQFACSGGLNNPNACPDFAPFLFVRVRRVDSLEVSNRVASVYDDCK